MVESIEYLVFAITYDDSRERFSPKINELQMKFAKAKQFYSVGKLKNKSETFRF